MVTAGASTTVLFASVAAPGSVAAGSMKFPFLHPRQPNPCGISVWLKGTCPEASFQVLLAICRTSLEKCLFKFSAHFLFFLVVADL